MLRNRPASAALSVAASLLLVLLAQVAVAGPAAAHAELVSTTPDNGERLEQAPTEITLRFTESVTLIKGGLMLLDAGGHPARTPDPTIDGSTVHWTMPDHLRDGTYVVNWRVVSADSHPVGGAFVFGVGVTPDIVIKDPTAGPDLSRSVVVAKFLGYLGYALAAGAVMLLAFCWPRGRSHPVARLMVVGGFAGAAAAGVMGLLAQGPYANGVPSSRFLDADLIRETVQTG